MLKKLPSFVLLIIFTVSLCFSQNFKVREGLTTAINSSGISNPELLMCAAMNGTIAGSPISLEFNINIGVANAWLYFFRSADDHNTKKSVAVSRQMNIFIPIPLPNNQYFDSLDNEFDLAFSLNDVPWMDSDSIIVYLRNYQVYLDFINNHSNSSVSYVYLMKPDHDPGKPDNTYWLIMINASDTSLGCFVNALTGEVMCQEIPISSVEENEIGNYELSIYPNPAKDNLFITLPDRLSTINNELQIFDSEGKLIYSFAVKPVDGVNLISIPVKLFSAGHYFVNITSAKGILSGKFIIEK
ncbi:MAG: hypothetical protein A2X61_02985 [Ignavibacteria bacterium GWB2_35_12]|nr:MAG: hypothetical protein A2X63_11565 [Ignavibacteria bacterium GWA2_35_8]OGU38257.1 MAG: hypothetical protein A2X61_02985 [Ignavibacteria bacterium GWB2_35_12]OGU95478.1 MAG: hypothetical protein A2220_07160 [Ignavibacteria bacterium RIFOXYA2_FULL_35_10]OGV20805.1 MAG: hypothetical protein A2475_11560 [Ignavibacteria bacterium RIFOXYC2_FULL_35_21]